eukprot:PhF_6_TR11419/c0_g1_i1/m.18371
MRNQKLSKQLEKRILRSQRCDVKTRTQPTVVPIPNSPMIPPLELPYDERAFTNFFQEHKGVPHKKESAETHRRRLLSIYMLLRPEIQHKYATTRNTTAASSRGETDHFLTEPAKSLPGGFEDEEE